MSTTILPVFKPFLGDQKVTHNEFWDLKDSNGNPLWQAMNNFFKVDNLYSPNALGFDLQAPVELYGDTQVVFEYSLFALISAIDPSTGKTVEANEDYVNNRPTMNRSILYLKSQFRGAIMYDLVTKQTCTFWAQLFSDRISKLMQKFQMQKNVIVMQAVTDYNLVSGQFGVFPQMDDNDPITNSNTDTVNKQIFYSIMKIIAQKKNNIVQSFTQYNLGFDKNRIRYLFSPNGIINLIAGMNQFSQSNLATAMFQSGNMGSILGTQTTESEWLGVDRSLNNTEGVYLQSGALAAPKGQGVDLTRPAKYANTFGIVFAADTVRAYQSPVTIIRDVQHKGDERSRHDSFYQMCDAAIQPTREYMNLTLYSKAPTYDDYLESAHMLLLQPNLYSTLINELGITVNVDAQGKETVSVAKMSKTQFDALVKARTVSFDNNGKQSGSLPAKLSVLAK